MADTGLPLTMVQAMEIEALTCFYPRFVSGSHVVKMLFLEGISE